MIPHSEYFAHTGFYIAFFSLFVNYFLLQKDKEILEDIDDNILLHLLIVFSLIISWAVIMILPIINIISIDETRQGLHLLEITSHTILLLLLLGAGIRKSAPIYKL